MEPGPWELEHCGGAVAQGSIQPWRAAFRCSPLQSESGVRRRSDEEPMRRRQEYRRQRTRRPVRRIFWLWLHGHLHPTQCGSLPLLPKAA